MYILLLVVVAGPFVGFLTYLIVLRILVLRKSFLDRGPGASSQTVSKSKLTYSFVVITTSFDQKLLDKIYSLLDLNQPDKIAEIIIGLDGCLIANLDETMANHAISLKEKSNIIYIESMEHVGKNELINRALSNATSDVIVFTDIDSKIGHQVISKLQIWFNDSTVGAVAGSRVIQDNSSFGEAQNSYVNLDTKIKKWEMHVMGQVTSCDGKLYAIRKRHVDPIPLHVTDDTYIGLGAPKYNKRLVFDDSLQAIVGRPAKNPAHEFRRRRRVTTRGLSTLVERRELFNISKHGFFSLSLFANKFLRRFAPLSLFTTIFFLTISIHYLFSVAALTLALGTIVISYIFLNDDSRTKSDKKKSRASSILKIFSSISYFVLGMSSMSMGVFDFLIGKKIVKWSPVKS